jgi:hypothetical protein
MSSFDELYESYMGMNENSDPINNNNFKRWFSGSKVTDRNGNPLVVYHGSPNKVFDAFDINKLAGTSLMEKSGPGFYFTDKKNAKTYTKSINKVSRGGKSGLYDVLLSIKKPLRIKEYNSKVITLEQAIKLFQNGDNPWFYSNWVPFSKGGAMYQGRNWTEDDIKELSDKEKGKLFATFAHNWGDQDILQDIHRAYKNPQLMFNNMRKILKSDGVILSDSYGEIYVAWDPNQIKSASENNGNYSLTDNNIYK